MLASIITIIGVAALTTWLGYLAVRYLLPRAPHLATAIAARQQSARDRVRSDPLDHVRAWVVRIAPSRMKAEQQIQAAQTIVDQADERATHFLTAFKDGKEPSFGTKVTAMTLFIAWLVAVAAVFIIDVPIVSSVSGGNVLYAVVGTVLLIVVPIIFSVLVGHFFVKRRRGEMHPVLFSAALIGIIALVAAIVCYLASLAPMRAEVEYADKIRSVEQQLVMYREDGDRSAVAFAEQNLADLQAQQERSEEWNTMLVPMAAVAEFATGFFFPLAIPILLLADVKSSRRRAERTLTTARNRMNNQRARQYARLSREFQRLGLAQVELQQHLTAVAAQNNADQAGIEATRNGVANELAAQAPAPPEPAGAAPISDQTGAVEIVHTDDTHAATPPPAAPPRRHRPPTAEPPPTAGRATAEQRAPDPTLEPDDVDHVDDSFDLN